ncbi:MAG: hypothetical protein JMDDDDMK_00902 [Acidobacteria bacterium]|nr:hypothetical protein [Acidobacteriota bacterium]
MRVELEDRVIRSRSFVEEYAVIADATEKTGELDEANRGNIPAISVERLIINDLAGAVGRNDFNAEATSLITAFAGFFVGIARRLVEQTISRVAYLQMVNAGPSARPSRGGDLFHIERVNRRFSRPGVHSYHLEA